MPGIVLKFPILAGKTEAWRRFCQEMAGSRLELYEASRRRLGITRERMALVETLFGAEAITTVEANNIGRALVQIMTSNLPFDCWYRERLNELHGVNLTHFKEYAQPAPSAQPQELLFEWGGTTGPRENKGVKT
jgi:hypothetical protein